MSDIVERLRGLIKREPWWDVHDDIDAAADDIERLRADVAKWKALETAAAISTAQERIRVLEEALRLIADGGEPRLGKVVYRSDGKPSKYDTCQHSFAMYDDCGECTREFAAAVLNATEPT